MSDGVAITAGSGTTIATDDIGGVHYQRIKLSLGADGTANDASAGAGAVGTGTQRVTLASDDPAVTLLTAQASYLDGIEALIGSTNTALATIDGRVDGVETLIGSTNTKLDAIAAGLPVFTPGDVISVTPTLDTSAYASGDVLFATTAIASAVRANDQRAILQSLCVIDKDDQKTAFKLHFFSSNVTFGTANSAPSISDSDAASYLGTVSVAAADYEDLGGVSVANLRAIGLMLEAAAGGTTIYVAATTSTTPTHTAAGLVLRLGLVWM